MEQHPLVQLIDLVYALFTRPDVGAGASVVGLILVAFTYRRAGRIRYEMEKQSFFRHRLKKMRRDVNQSKRYIRGALLDLERGGIFQRSKATIDSEATKCSIRLSVIVEKTKDKDLMEMRRRYRKIVRRLRRLSDQAYKKSAWEIYSEIDALSDHLSNLAVE